MERRSHPILYLAFFGSVVIIAIGLGWHLANRSKKVTEPELKEGGYNAPDLEMREIHLYFGDHQGRYLKTEQRIVKQAVDAVAYGQGLLISLLKGPNQGATPTLPQGVDLRAFYITGDGIAFVDFESGSFDRHPGGVECELLTIYSIVNTLVLNVDEIRSVKLLIGGQEAATLAGHVDLSHPFKADMLWVR